MPHSPRQKFAHVGGQIEADQGLQSRPESKPTQDDGPGKSIYHQAEQAQANPQRQPEQPLGVWTVLDQLAAVLQQGRQDEAKADQGD